VVLKDESRSERGFVSAAPRESLLGAVGEVLTELRPSGSVRLTGVLADIVNEYGQTKLLVFDGIIIEIHFRSSSKRWYYCYDNILSFIDSFVNMGIIYSNRFISDYITILVKVVGL
jgi:hypothetical protein